MDHWFFKLFLFLYVFHLVVEWSLDALNGWALSRHQGSVPALYRGLFSEEDYRKSIAYTRSKMRFGWIKGVFDVLVLWTLILSGGFYRLDQWLNPWLTPGSLGHLIAYPFLLGGILYLLNLPFGIYFQFVLEEKYGFNRMKPLTFLGDQIKTILLSLLLGVPILAALFWSVERIGPKWWLAGWALMLGVQFLGIALFPILFAPLFYKFTPLPDGALKEKIEGLARKVRFKMGGIFTIDGSRRSSHSNAFFAGMGKARRIVLFDTLVKNLRKPEIVAVLAHEMGHDVKLHIQKGLVFSAWLSFIGFYILAQLLGWKPFFSAFGVPEPNLAIAFVLFGLVSSVFTFPFQPLMKWFSRKNEYEADRFSAKVTGDKDAMISALLKLSKDNLSNLTPHPWYSFYHYSHPTTAERAAALEKLRDETKRGERGEAGIP